MKNKITRKFKFYILPLTVVVAIIASLACFVSCGDDKTPTAPTKYSVVYDLDGGEGTLPTETDKAYGDKFALAAATGLTKDDCVFAGWNDGSDTFDAGAQYTMPAHNVTFTAQWRASGQAEDEFQVIYEYNLGNVPHSGSVKPSVGTTGSAVKVKDGKQFNAIGYMFVGWSTKQNGVVSLSGGKEDGQYLPDDELVIGDKDITLYAQWAKEYTDKRGQSADKIYVYTPLIGKGLGAAILVRAGKPDKLGFVADGSETQSGYTEFTFIFDAADGGDLTGRLDSGFYAIADGTQGQYLQYDYVYMSTGAYVLATDGFGFATLSEVVGSQTAVRYSGVYEYDDKHDDYAFSFVSAIDQTPASGWFTVEKREVDGTRFDGIFCLQGMESGSYLLYDNGELLNYRLDLNGYGAAKLYEYDASTQQTILSAQGRYCGTADYDDFMGEWEFTPERGTPFRFILNSIQTGTDSIPVYVEYNARYDVAFDSAKNDGGKLVLDGYIGAKYTANGVNYIGNYAVGSDNLITFIPYLDDGEGGVTAGGTMYFNVDWTAKTFTVNTTGFVTDGTVLVDYKGSSQIVEIPDGITEIADGAFSSVNTDVSLISVTVPASVTEIGKLAFQNNYTLRRAVFLSGTPVSIDFSNANDPFRWPSGDFIIVVPEGSQDAYISAWPDCPYSVKGSVEVTLLPEFEIKDGVLVRYNKQPDTPELIDITIPADVTAVAANVFRGVDYLRSVNLNNVTTVGEGAFERCKNLTTVVFTNVLTLGEGAFADCYKLATGDANGVIELPAVVTVGANAFQSCIGLKLVRLGANLAEIGDMAFRECQIYDTDPPLFVELLGSVPPSLGEKVSVGNIGFRFKVQNISVAIACFKAAGWNNYCRHLYIESGAEKGKYMCGADLLDIDGRATFQSTYLMMYAINGSEISFYEYDASTGTYTTAVGKIEGGKITVEFVQKEYEFIRVDGERTYSTADGKYTLKCDPLALLPESYENNQGVADVIFNGAKVKMSVNGFGTRKISGFTDSDGKVYDVTIDFDGNTLVVRKKLADIILNVSCVDGSTLTLRYSGPLTYVFGTLKIKVGPNVDGSDIFLTWSDGGTLAVFSADNENVFTFSVRYLNVKYTVTVTLNAERTAFTYSHTTD